MMKRSTAAAYLEISEASFVREIFAGRMPTSVILGGRERWRRDSIDAALDHLCGEVKPEMSDARRRFWSREYRDGKRVQADPQKSALELAEPTPSTRRRRARDKE